MGHLIKMARKSAKKKTGGKKKRRRKKMKLTLRSRKMKSEHSYFDKVGWSTTGGERLLDEQPQSDEPTEIDHQCSMCGSMNRIPRPTTDKYKVRCAHPECEFEDEVGF